MWKLRNFTLNHLWLKFHESNVLLEFLSGNLKTQNFFFPIKMHPFASSLFFLGNLRKKVLLPPGFELQTFLSTVLYLCLKTTKSSYEIWVKVVFMNWSNNEHRKGCILMGKIFFQVFKLHDKNSSNYVSFFYVKSFSVYYFGIMFYIWMTRNAKSLEMLSITFYAKAQSSYRKWN